jgi:hypothetical protein
MAIILWQKETGPSREKRKSPKRKNPRQLRLRGREFPDLAGLERRPTGNSTQPATVTFGAANELLYKHLPFQVAVVPDVYGYDVSKAIPPCFPTSQNEFQAPVHPS